MGADNLECGLDELAQAFDLSVVDVVKGLINLGDDILFHRKDGLFVRQGQIIIGLNSDCIAKTELDPLKNQTTKVDIFEKRAGVYFLFSKKNLVYVGKTTNLYMRLNNHVRDGKKIFDSFSFVEYGRDMADLMEQYTILHHRPFRNICVPSQKSMLVSVAKKVFSSEEVAQ